MQLCISKDSRAPSPFQTPRVRTFLVTGGAGAAHEPGAGRGEGGRYAERLLGGGARGAASPRRAALGGPDAGHREGRPLLDLRQRGHQRGLGTQPPQAAAARGVLLQAAA